MTNPKNPPINEEERAAIKRILRDADLKAGSGRAIEPEQIGVKPPPNPAFPSTAAAGMKQIKGAKRTYDSLPPAERQKVDALVIRELDSEINLARCSGGESGSGETKADKKVHEMFVKDRYATRKKIADLRDQFANVDVSGVKLDKRSIGALKDGVIDSKDFEAWKLPMLGCQAVVPIFR